MAEDKRCAVFSLVWISAFIMSLALIVVGGMNQWQWNDYHHHHDSTCTLEPRIPVYMIVAGSLNITYLLLRFVFQVRTHVTLEKGVCTFLWYLARDVAANCICVIPPC